MLGWYEGTQPHTHAELSWCVLLSQTTWSDWRETTLNCHSTPWMTSSKSSVRFPRQCVRTERGSSPMMPTLQCYQGKNTITMFIYSLISCVTLYIDLLTPSVLQCLIRWQRSDSRWRCNVKEYFWPVRQHSGHERVWRALPCAPVHRPEDPRGKDLIFFFSKHLIWPRHVCSFF